MSENIVLKWESGEKTPTLAQIRQLAKFYKRPLAAFFLPHPPSEPAPPADFRTLPRTLKKPFSEKMLLALRRTRRLQSLVAELATASDQRMEAGIGEASLSDDPEDLASRTRESIRVPIKEQLSWKKESDALAEWKKAVEALGILVSELSFPIEEGRAFSLADKASPVIVVNSNDAIHGRIFSLFHEYGHLLLGQSGICDLTEEGKSVERFCNRFAGGFLVPKGALVENEVTKNHTGGSRWSDEELLRLTQEFKVSREVILRRFLILGLTDEAFYQRKRAEWEIQLKEQTKRRMGRRIPARQCLRQNGVPFVSLALEAAHQDKITYRDLSDYLSISLKHLPTVESLVREERARYG
jgi:Zn-dependent peptidase ImmA (M78 family)